VTSNALAPASSLVRQLLGGVFGRLSGGRLEGAERIRGFDLEALTRA
jgi:hypothetical protein